MKASFIKSLAKKAATIGMTAALVCSMAGCGGSNTTPTGSNASEETTVSVESNASGEATVTNEVEVTSEVEATSEEETTSEGNTSEAASESVEIDTLRVCVSPYQDADILLAGLSSLGDNIKTEMAKEGVIINNVDLTVGTSYSVVGEALSAGTVDVGFVSGGTYVTYDEECDVLLTALRQAINKDSLDPKEWNDGTEEAFTDDLTTYYRSVILAGPSAKGQELAAKVNAGEELTWEDLDGATWAVMGASSASGYIYPSLWLYNKFGKQISDLSNVVQSDSYTTSMSRLAAEQVDILVAYAHIRAKLGPTWDTDLGGTGNVYEQTAVLAVTDQIMDDTICVSKNSPVVTEEFKKAFGNAMIRIGETEEGLETLKVLSHVGYRFADAKDYDPERAAQDMLK